MSDLISRADAICEVLVNDGIDNIVDRINKLTSAEAVSREEYEEVKEEYINTVGAILAVISAPSCLKEVNDLIEPLKVVRCKDCRHRCKEPIYSNADVHWVIYQIGDCPIICKTVSDDDYCSYGERREPCY